MSDPIDYCDPSQATAEQYDEWLEAQRPAPTPKPAPPSPPAIEPVAEAPPFSGKLGGYYPFGRTLGPAPAPAPISGRPAGRI